MKIISGSWRQTLAIGRRIARHAKAGDIVCLFGALGSGKTVLTKGIAAGLGVAAGRVTSPSFVLLREYADAHLPLYHFDLYRLEAEQEITALGYEEYLYGEGITVIEWAERLGSLLPEEFLKVEFSMRGPNSRVLTVTGRGRRYRELLEQIK